MCVWPYFLFLFTLLAQTSTFLSVCGNCESTPSQSTQFQFLFRYFCFVLFCFWYRQEKGKEVRKQEENGWEEKWGGAQIKHVIRLWHPHRCHCSTV